MSNILIIAGSSDIGFATARKLISLGHKVHCTTRNPSYTEAIEQLGASCSILDASNFNDVLETFQSFEKNTGAIDGVVNCAGSFLLKPAHLTSQQDYHKTIEANLTTAFATVHAAGKTMSTHGGSVVLLSSTAATVGLPNHEAISAAKAGIIGLAQSAAATYSHCRLRFNVVAPGLTQTKLTSAMTANESSRKISESMHPLGRIGQPDDIAAAIVFLLSDESSWITGQVLPVDGGLSHVRGKPKV